MDVCVFVDQWLVVKLVDLLASGSRVSVPEPARGGPWSMATETGSQGSGLEALKPLCLSQPVYS